MGSGVAKEHVQGPPGPLSRAQWQCWRLSPPMTLSQTPLPTSKHIEGIHDGPRLDATASPFGQQSFHSARRGKEAPSSQMGDMSTALLVHTYWGSPHLAHSAGSFAPCLVNQLAISPRPSPSATPRLLPGGLPCLDSSTLLRFRPFSVSQIETCSLLKIVSSVRAMSVSPP
ncbi:hypothetical protein COCSADRAFT_318812 [Bipolaris sorokiniana ND90Pr]|uniref:Uncharacterized protein n=1 Tax=Cochliobolus sativus (strain ND90Pr / ATCC 201652) TaxID=665912 RepID=M2T7H6_COCSN|nr:uncharacterized protein COCSADRAFT_318812 [Bipolaris sorokiniana ND90Pr]EMD65171.1 hypothetical protein COCSADRAFT_318812 [Bipolaris sorokiniana ND90Pr]